MARRDNGGCKISLCFVLFVVYSSLCQCISLKSLQTPDKIRENAMLGQGQGEMTNFYYGRLLIGLNSVQAAKGTKTPKDFLDVDSDYQSDIPQSHSLKGWEAPGQREEQGDSLLKPNNAAVEQLLKMDPKVECTGDSMRLQVQDAAFTPGALFFVDRGSRLSPLPLSKLPQSCGYTVQSTWRDLVLVAPYDGCFVTLEEDSYVLPLCWWGLPVRMSCPLRRQSSPNPPMVTCHPEGLVVKTLWTLPASNIKVNINGNWEPLMKVLPRCGFSVVAHAEGVVISVRYAPCLQKMDGMYSIGLSGDGETKISCPSVSLVPAHPTQTPAMVPYHPPNPEVPQPFIPSEFYPWQAPLPPNSEVKEPSYPFNIMQMYVPPEWKPTASPPVVQTTQTFYPLPFYPQPTKHGIPPTQATVTKPASKMVRQPPYPVYPEPPGRWELEPKPVPSKPPVSEDFQRQMYPSFYAFHPSFIAQNPYETPVQPIQQTSTPAPKYQGQQTLNPTHSEASTPEAHGNHPYYPFDYFPQPLNPFLAWPEKPTATPEPPIPPQTEAPQGQMQQPIYLFPFNHVQGPKTPAAATEPPITPQTEAPQGQMQDLLGLHYYLQQSQHPQPGTTPPTPQKPQLVMPPSNQRPLYSLVPQPINIGIIPQGPQPHTMYLSPVHCPQVCPAGFSNCCPQIAFHQHLHHFFPVGHDGKDNPPVYRELPIPSSVAHSGFGHDWGYPPLAQKPSEAQKTKVSTTSAPQLPQFPPVGMQHEEQPYLQPPDGNTAALPGSNPSKGTHYPYWQVLSQDEELQSQSETFPGVPPKFHSQIYDPVNLYGQYNVLDNVPLLPGDMTNPSGPNLMYIKEHVQLQPSSNAKRPPMSITEFDPHLFPYQMLQDAQAPTYKKLSDPNHSSQMHQPVNVLKKSAKSDETDHSHSEPKGYVLLQHGPPDGKIRKSPLPFRELGRESDILSHKANDYKSEPQLLQNLKHLKSEDPKRLLKEKSVNVDLMPSPGDEPESLLSSASDGPHAVPLPQDPSIGAANLNPKFKSFKDFWKGSSRTIPHHGIPGQSLQHWSSAGDDQHNGMQ